MPRVFKDSQKMLQIMLLSFQHRALLPLRNFAQPRHQPFSHSHILKVIFFIFSQIEIQGDKRRTDEEV